MSSFHILSAVALFSTLLITTACGDKIGDSCSISTDCSAQGERICDGSSPDGYCTIAGCDFGTCPDEAVCVRFFGGVVDESQPCDPRTEDRTTDDCGPDDLCTLAGTCIPRSAERRFCMLKCDSGGDCRDEYECRTEALMREHGGEPVPKAGEALGTDIQSFCAVEPQPF